jgi:hypothetical protein
LNTATYVVLTVCWGCVHTVCLLHPHAVLSLCTHVLINDQASRNALAGGSMVNDKGEAQAGLHEFRMHINDFGAVVDQGVWTGFYAGLSVLRVCSHHVCVFCSRMQCLPCMHACWLICTQRTSRPTPADRSMVDDKRVRPRPDCIDICCNHMDGLPVCWGCSDTIQLHPHAPLAFVCKHALPLTMHPGMQCPKARLHASLSYVVHMLNSPALLPLLCVAVYSRDLLWRPSGSELPDETGCR